MRHLQVTIGAGLCATLLVACASQPTPALKQARARYQYAANHEPMKLSPVGLVDAKKALDKAEEAHRDDPGSYRETGLAYIAERRADLAIVRANTAYAKQTNTNAEKIIEEHKLANVTETQQQYQQTAEALEATSEAIDTTQREIAQEQNARESAEETMRRAVNSLKEIAQIKEESRGFVITLDGAVLFLIGQSTLLPEAQTRLDQVAKTLLDLGTQAKLRIEGHTDSTGTADDNMQLSQQRAQSVANYLITRGIDSSRIEVAGMGESQPVATNDTPQGRANNRRVEIIVNNSATTTPMNPGQSNQPSGSGVQEGPSDRTAP